MTGLGEKIRALFAKGGYTCDGCGREAFSYPEKRLCDDCAATLRKNAGFVCEKCGRKARSQGVCLACKQNLPEFAKGYSPFVYAGFAASLVNRLKNGERNLSNFFGEEMSAYVAEKIENPQELIVVSVPMTKERQTARGYNQAAELAKTVANNLDLLYDEEVLIKTRDAVGQKYLSGKERTENVRGAYRVHKRAFVRDKRVLLIDDVMTTGATGSECARILKNAGADEVIFLTAASLREPK